MIGRRRFAETEERRMEEQLSLDFLRVVENAAIAAARTMGFGDRHKAAEVAGGGPREARAAGGAGGSRVVSGGASRAGGAFGTCVRGGRGGGRPSERLPP